MNRTQQTYKIVNREGVAVFSLDAASRQEALTEWHRILGDSDPRFSLAVEHVGGLPRLWEPVLRLGDRKWIAIPEEEWSWSYSQDAATMLEP